MFSSTVLKFSALPSCYLWQEQLRLWRLSGGSSGGDVYSLFFCPRLLLSLPPVFYLEADPWHSVNHLLGGRQLVAPRRQLLILQHTPIGCQQMCLTRELIPQSIENCLLYACTDSLCASLFVPRCRWLPLLPSDIACAICRESWKTWVYFLVCLQLRQFWFLANFPFLDCQKIYACFSFCSGMLLSPDLLSIIP